MASSKKNTQQQRARVAAARAARTKAAAEPPQHDQRTQQAISKINRLAYALLFISATVTVVMIVTSMMNRDKEEDEAGSVMAEAAAVTVDGKPLPDFEGNQDDGAVGEVLPTFSGTGLDGKDVTLAPTGRNRLVVYLAHWCPHCQREVPRLVEWMRNGDVPDDVDIVGITTAIDRTRGNYPPTDWLEEENWDVPTLIDIDDKAMAASGLAGFPFFVLTDGDGKVVVRGSGELTLDQLKQMLAMAPGGSSATSSTSTTAADS